MNNQLDSMLALGIREAMRIETRVAVPTTWLRAFFSDQIAKAHTTGKSLIDEYGETKPFGPKSLFICIFGSLGAIPTELREILEANKKLKDPHGRAHNRLAWLISDIQRTTPRPQPTDRVETWQSLLSEALAADRKKTLTQLFLFLSEQPL